MAVISAGKASKSALGSMKYVEFEKHSSNHRAIFTAGIECSNYYLDASQDFQHVAHTFHKEGGRQAHHMVLAFSPEEERDFTPEQLMEKSIEVAKDVFPKHQIWLGMHDDTDHLHTHLIINAVNYETGKKLQIAGRKGMHEIMEKVQAKAQELGLDNHLEPGVKKDLNIGDIATHNTVERKILTGDNSWKKDMALTVLNALDTTTNPDEFIANCNDKGLGCSWEENRKHIVFYDLNDPHRKARASNLAKTFTLPDLTSKESLVLRLDNNWQEQQTQNQTLHKKEKEMTYYGR